MKRKEDRKSIAEKIADSLLVALRNGTVPWRRSWKPSHSGRGVAPTSYAGKVYRGVNNFLLAIIGAQFETPIFLTYRKARALGGNVKRGEKGFPVVFWKFGKRKVKDSSGNEAEKGYAFMRGYTVFNVSQCENVPLPAWYRKMDKKSDTPTERIESCEKIVAGYQNPPGVVENHEGKAYYFPPSDVVTMPTRDSFDSPESFYHTLFHELAHSTGNPSRLKRDLSGTQGSTSYAREELVAEISASMLAGIAGIDIDIENSAAYLGGWGKKLGADDWHTLIGEDPKAFVMACQRAQKAIDHILGETPEDSGEGSEETANEETLA